MALNSLELMAFIARMAQAHGADSVIMEPQADKVWQYDKSGRMIKAGVSPLDVEIKGNRLYCLPEDSGQGYHSCILYNEANVALEEFIEQFPA